MHPVKYKPEFCEMLIEHMKEGLSFSTFVAIAGVTRKTLYKWLETYPEFKEAKELAFANSQLFFEQRLSAKVLGRKTSGIDNSEVCTSSLIFALKTRFRDDYTEKKEIEASGNIQINVDKEDVGL